MRAGRPRHHRLRAEPRRRARPHHPGDARFCADQAKGVTAWPFAQIAEPCGHRRAARLLDDLRKASDEAATRFKASCPDTVPMTPPGRLQAMIRG